MSEVNEIAPLAPDQFVQAQSNGDVPMVYYNMSSRPGVYIHWDRTLGVPPAFYQVLRAEQFDGNYTTIASLMYPANEYVDTNGHPSFYYKIREIDAGNVVVSTSQPMIGDELLILASLAFQIKDLLRVPVYDEEITFKANRTSAVLTFTNWAFWPRPEIRISGPSNQGDRDAWQILDENTPIFTTVNGSDNYPNGLKFKLDYQGKIYFTDQNDQPQRVQNADSILASYNVRLFSGSEMNDSLNMALQAINSQPGSSKYRTVASCPLFYDAALISGASYYLLRALLTGMTQREKRYLLQDPDSGAYDTIKELRETAKMYQDDFKEFLKTVPIASYPRITAIVTPEYYLPGGRSRFFRQIWKGGA